MSAVPELTFTDAGLVIPQETDIVAGVLTDLNAAFGGGLNTTTLSTPQGQIATSEAAIIGDKNAQIAYVVNQFDPQYASGRWQDALARIYFLTRKPATPTVVICQCTGVPNSVIPAGCIVQDAAGNLYTNPTAATIGAGSTVSVTFECTATGAVACPAGTVTKIYQAVSGWDSVTNAAAGVVGTVVESRSDFELRRQNSVAINAKSTPESIYANVFAVDGVQDCYVTDNPSNATVTVGATSYSLLPHSLYVAAVGGADADIAAAIWAKKDVGCDYNGNTSVTITDPSGYSYPQPQYVVKFERPDALAVHFVVTIVNDPLLPTDITQLIQTAVFNRFYGNDGTTRERIGATIFSSRYYQPLAGTWSGLAILSVQVGVVGSGSVSGALAVGVDQYPTLDVANIDVVLQS